MFPVTSMARSEAPSERHRAAASASRAQILAAPASSGPIHGRSLRYRGIERSDSRALTNATGTFLSPRSRSSSGQISVSTATNKIGASGARILFANGAKSIGK